SIGTWEIHSRISQLENEAARVIIECRQEAQFLAMRFSVSFDSKFIHGRGILQCCSWGKVNQLPTGEGKNMWFWKGFVVIFHL
ncbi:unnamed protein product, partial [Linum tenue]